MWFQPQVEVYMCGKLKRSHFSLIWCRHQELVTVFFFFFFNRLKNIDSYSEDFQKKNFRQIWWNCTNEYRLLLINPKEILLNWLFFFISLISLQLIFLFCIQQGHCLQNMSMNSSYNEALGKFRKRRKKSLCKWSLKEDQSSMALHHEKVQWKHRMCGNPELC